MDLTGALLRAGAARPHVLAVAVPGATRVRLAAEARLRRRGWPAAMTPADADILLVCGDAGGPMMAAVEEAWRAMPAPRARASASRPGEVEAALEAARARLGDRAAQRDMAAEMTGMDMDAGPGGMDMSGMDMSGMHMDGMHMNMDTGGMVVRGLRMASRGDDRDGLRLDQLHVPLGPVLPDWPAGLVLHLTLQGDVIQQAEPEVLAGGEGGGSFWDEPWRRAAAGESVTSAEAARRSAAARLDSLGRLLAVAGWDAAAAAARRLRDDLLAGTLLTAAGAPPDRLCRDVRRLARRVARSRMLAWLTRGLGPLAGGDATGGDVTARYRRWCADLEDAAAALDDTSPLRQGGGSHASPDGLVAALPRLLEGTELGGARLIVASLDPDPDQLARHARTPR